MLSIRVWHVAAMIGVTVLSSQGFGQSSSYSNTAGVRTPASDIGGFTGTTLSNIYRDSIGRGFSASELNRMTLQRSAGIIPYVGQSDVARGNIGRVTGLGSNPGLGLGSSPASKPFSSITSSPTTSAYLGLFRDEFDDNLLPNYNTYVQPRMRQQSATDQLQRRTQELNVRLQQIVAQPTYNARGSEQQYPTGHSVGFRYYSHFYPQMARRR